MEEGPTMNSPPGSPFWKIGPVLRRARPSFRSTLRGGRPPFRPGVEQLEDRDLLSVSLAPDLVVANANDNTVSVLLGNGDGSFQPQPTRAVGSAPSSVTVADVNGD